MSSPSSTSSKRDREEDCSDEAEQLLGMIHPPQPTVEEQLQNAKDLLRQLVDVHKIAEHAYVVPLNLSCDGCHQPFIEDNDGEDPSNYFDNLTMCERCVQLGKKVMADKKRRK